MNIIILGTARLRGEEKYIIDSTGGEDMLLRLACNRRRKSVPTYSVIGYMELRDMKKVT